MATTTRKIIIWVLAFSLFGGCAKNPPPFLEEYASIDLLIENGQVLDGLRGDAKPADIAVVGEKIVFVGDAQFTTDDLGSRIIRRIDANGRIVTPGFIDLDAHGDPFETPEFENFLAMGVTTIALGQDGSSPEVADLANWMEQVASNGIGQNLVMFVGHGTLRTLSGIGRARIPAPDDLERMLEMLDTSLKVAFGMSTGLEYNPGLNAQREELAEYLRNCVNRRNRPEATLLGPDGVSAAYWVSRTGVSCEQAWSPICSFSILPVFMQPQPTRIRYSLLSDLTW